MAVSVHIFYDKNNYWSAVQEAKSILIVSIENLALVQWKLVSGLANSIRPFVRRAGAHRGWWPRPACWWPQPCATRYTLLMRRASCVFYRQTFRGHGRP